MSRLGLQARDALALAYTKFKIRRIRTTLTLITTSILAMMLVVGSSVLTGFIRAANASPQSALADLHLASTSPDFAGAPSPDPSAAPSPVNVAGARQQMRDRVRDKTSLREVYVAAGAEGDASVDIVGAPPVPGPNASFEEQINYMPRRLAAYSTPLVAPYVEPGQALEWKVDQPLPIFVPADAVSSAHRAELKKIKDSAAKAAKQQEYQRALIGKTATLKLAPYAGPTVFRGGLDGSASVASGPAEPIPQSKTISVRVVGILPGSTLLGQAITDYVIPQEVASKDPSTSALMTSLLSVYPSFTSNHARGTYLSYDQSASVYADTVEENKRFFSPLQKAFGIAVIVMLVLMAIPMAATMSKLLSDSQRETGVFRAIGASARHILAIYGIYTVLLVTASFLVALALGQAICGVLTAVYADDIRRIGSEYSGPELPFSFNALDPRHLAIIYLGLLGGALLGVVIPLARALRRDPIKSLRDE